MDTHLKRLHYSDLRRINAEAQAIPALTPTLASSEALQCPVCLEFKGHNSIIHLNCWRLICTPCTIQLIDDHQECPLCRGSLRESFGPTWVIKPPPLVRSMIDNVDYQCDQCKLVMKETNARSHLNKCAQTERHRPPPYIPPRGENPFLFKELVSNPLVLPDDLATSDRRLIVHYHNGRQVTSKSVPSYHSVHQWKSRLANLLDADVGEIKIYKFAHRELKDDDLIRDVARSRGATYLASFAKSSDYQNLATRTANLILHELGPEPYIKKPAANPPSDWTDGWGPDYSEEDWNPPI